MTIETANALMAVYDRLKASPAPRHRPPTIDAALLRFAIAEHVAREHAKGVRMKEIIANLRERHNVSRAHVFDARASLDPTLRATIESAAIAELELERRLTPT